MSLVDNNYLLSKLEFVPTKIIVKYGVTKVYKTLVANRYVFNQMLKFEKVETDESEVLNFVFKSELDFNEMYLCPTCESPHQFNEDAENCCSSNSKFESPDDDSDLDTGDYAECPICTEYIHWDDKECPTCKMDIYDDVTLHINVATSNLGSNLSSNQLSLWDAV